MQELIAVRVKDGIFAGNVIASQDRDFIAMNKITHIINCAGGELPGLFVDDGVKYLTFPWKDTAGAISTAVMFDSADENIERTVRFIDEALDAGDCVLVHSYFGLSRSPALIAAYFIVKYGWKLDNALSFLEMAHKDMSIKPHFLRQLRIFAKRNSVDHDVFDTDVDDSQFGLDNDQWMLRNTLLNGLSFDAQRHNGLFKLCTRKIELGKVVKPVDSQMRTHERKTKRIVFVDTKQGTHVDSEIGTPVVNVQSLQQLDSGNHFLGFHGSVSLRSWHRRSGSIMSRSITPCNRRAESDPRSNPRGRQELAVVRPDAKVGRSLSTLDGATSSQAARTASGDSALDGGGHAAIEPRRIASPSTVHAPGRSPFAALTSTHKYRKGSPLPASTRGKKPERSTQRPASAFSADTNSSRLRAGASIGAARATTTRNSLVRTSSPNASGGNAAATSAAISSARASSYKNIAPHRSQANPGVAPAWEFTSRLTETPTVLQRSSLPSSPQCSRRGSPMGRPVSATARVSSPRGGSAEPYQGSLANGRANPVKGVVRRQSPAVITSNRRP